MPQALPRVYECALGYFFVRRNYDSLKMLLEAYSETYGEVEGITKLISGLA